MNVKVLVVASVLPTEKDLDDLRFAAFQLTDKQDSIAVEMKEEGGHFF